MFSRSSLTRHTPLAPWRWAVVGALLGLALAVVVFAPARWLAHGLAQASGARVQLLHASGTVWNGSAQLTLGAGGGSQTPTALPGRIQWRLSPSLRGLHIALQAECCIQQAWVWTLTPGWNRMQLQLSDQSLAQPSLWPGALLAGLGTPWNTLQMQGTLALSTHQFAVQWAAGRWQVSGQARLDARELSTSLSTLKPMGSYRLALAGGETPTLQLSTLEGSLNVSGTGRWVGGILRFEGEASAAPDRAEALENLLNIIGRREGARSIITVG